MQRYCFFAISSELPNFADKMKMMKITHLLVLLVVSAGLLYLTRSFWMSLGIMMLLLLVDALLAQYERKHRSKDDDTSSERD